MSALAMLDEKEKRWLELGKAIEEAAGSLPDGYELHVEVEKGAGSVALYDPDCDRIEQFEGDTLADQANEAVAYACAAAGEQGA